MSETIAVNLLAETMAVLYMAGRRLAAYGKETPMAIQRHLIRQNTQMTDGHLLRQTLTTIGIAYREGKQGAMWGGDLPIELQADDANGRPWFALVRDGETGSYAILSLDRSHPQDELPPEARLSEADPQPILNRAAQHYGYLATLRALLQDGYALADQPEADHPDGSRALMLQKYDPASDEHHTVRLVFKAEGGEATILTDSCRADGSHGVCPDVDTLLESIGLAAHDKWISPAARHAKAEAELPASARKPKSDSERQRRPSSKANSEA